MNPFIIGTLTLATLCLGGAFAALVTALDNRRRRDAEVAGALGHVLTRVDQQIASLTDGSTRVLSIELSLRLARLEEQLTSALAAVTAARVEAPLPTLELAPDEAALSEPAAVADTLSSAVDDNGPGSEEDRELAALMAEFADEKFSFASHRQGPPESVELDVEALLPLEDLEEHESKDLFSDALKEVPNTPPFAGDDLPTPTQLADVEDGAELELEPVFELEFETALDAELDDLVLSIADDALGVDEFSQTHAAAADEPNALEQTIAVALEAIEGEGVEAVLGSVATEPPAGAPLAAPGPVITAGASPIENAADTLLAALAAGEEAARDALKRLSIEQVTSLATRIQEPGRNRDDRARLLSELNRALARFRR